MSTFRIGLGAGTGTTGTAVSFGAKPTTATTATAPPQKLTYEQLDATTKKLVEGVQEKVSEKMLADEIQQRSSEPIERVTEDSSLMIEKLQTLLGTVNQDNSEAVGLKREYTALLRHVDQLTSLVERAGAMGAQMESRQAAWDNYQLANLPSKYFRELVSTFESRMLEYRQTIETIEQFVDTSSSIKVYTPSMLKEIMQAQMEYFLTLTAQVSTLHDGLQDLQEHCVEALKDRPGITMPTFVDAYAPKVKKEKVVPPARFEYAAPEVPPGAAAPTTSFAAGAAKPGFGTTTGTTGFGAKAAGTTGYGTTGGFGGAAKTTGFASGAGTTGFGGAAKPTGFSTGAGFGAKPAGGFGSTGAATTGATGFGGAAKTGFAAPGAAKTGFGGAATGGTFGAKPTGFGSTGAAGYRPTTGF